MPPTSGQVGQLPAATGPSCLPYAAIVMFARRPGGHGFTFFHRRLAAAFGMNMKPCLPGGSARRVGANFESAVGFGRFDAADRLTDALGGHD